MNRRELLRFNLRGYAWLRFFLDKFLAFEFRDKCRRLSIEQFKADWWRALEKGFFNMLLKLCQPLRLQRRHILLVTIRNIRWVIVMLLHQGHQILKGIYLPRCCIDLGCERKLFESLKVIARTTSRRRLASLFKFQIFISGNYLGHQLFSGFTCLRDKGLHNCDFVFLW